jgi:capsid assembly protease
MSVMEERVWAGSEGSYDAALTAEQGIAERLASGQFDDDEDEDYPRLLSVEDGIATVAIKGPLVNSDSPYLQYFGMTGYPEIRAAMLAAAEDPEVTQILLDIDSGGGAISGVDDTAKLIRLVNDRVKPVTTYTDGAMCSAAYWLGSSAGDVFASKGAIVGSIGVIATHKEYSEAYKKEGVGVTVVRAGKFKALANSNEKLTEAGKAQLQKIVDASYEIFVDHVAAMRGKSYEYADKTMADGQEFIGQASVDVGLVDAVKTFDALITDLKGDSVAQSTKLMDNRNNDRFKLSGSTSTELSGDANMAKKALTEADIAALAAGVQVTASAEPEPAAEANAGDAAADVAAAEVGSVEQSSQNAEAAPVAEDVKTAATVQLLTSQIQERDASLLAAGIKIAKLEEQVAEMAATSAPLVEIAAHAVSNMRIAMRGSAYSAEGFTPVQVLAEYKSISEQFKKQFPVGGVAAVSGDAPAEKTQVDPRHLARVNAVRFAK